MTKKHFIRITLIGALLIFSLLPVINYITDPTRVLHHDYKNRYEKFHPNKLFLKVLHLLDNKDKYDTLVYGSSRGGFVDVRLVSDKAFNMSHGFGSVSTYLHSLKVLVENDVKIKNVWIAVNDYDIWKDNQETIDKLLHKGNFIDNVPVYADWLFRKTTQTNINILKGEMPLLKSEYITDTSKRIERARIQEKTLFNFKKRNIPAATLGYTGKFRIDEVIDEMKKIKTLCNENDIKLTVFMYPIYSATYISYDQSKIEEFKRKLTSVVNFYDFYELSDLAIRQTNWFEGSHFTPSIGDYMIKNIHQNNFLVSKENIDSRIVKTRALVKKNMPILLKDKVHQRHIYLDINATKIIFDINNKFEYYKNDQFNLVKNKLSFDALVDKEDPYFILNTLKTQATQTLLTFHLDSQHESVFQLYLKETKKSSYGEGNRYRVPIKKGMNHFEIVIPGKYINNALRVDFTKTLGTYKIKQFMIQEIEEFNIVKR